MPDFDRGELDAAAPGIHNHIEPEPSGFTVTATSDRTLVRVKLAEWEWHVTEAGSPGPRQAVALVRTPELVSVIAKVLRQSWKRADGSYPAMPLRDAQRRIARCIYQRVAAEAKRLLHAVPEEVLMTQRSVFAATRGNGMDTRPELYVPEFAMLRGDVRRYRAAAAALVLCDVLIERAVRAEVKTSAEYAAASAVAERAGLQIYLSPPWQQQVSPPWQQRDGNCNRANLEYLARGWMGLFSPDAKPYTSLTRTLMNVPSGVPPRMLARLVGIRLERPITDRLVLLTLLSAPCALGKTLGMPPWVQDDTRDGDAQITRMLQHATREQVVRTVQIAGAAMRRPLSATRIADIADAMSWVCDYPGDHRGTVVGLARKSARWHRDRMQDEAAKAIEQLGGDRKTTVPPVLLPAAEGVEFLGTVARVAHEGAQMNHCAASYAKAAAAGHCYLFHVEHGGEHASAEVSPQGEVRQVHGPGNRDNDACRYGRRVLTRWGRQLRSVTTDSPEYPPRLAALAPPWARVEPMIPRRYAPGPPRAQ
jgi:hypothetical protein